MIGQRDNILKLIANNDLKSIYVLIRAKSNKDDEKIEDTKRITDTIGLCKNGKVNLQIRQIDLEKYDCLKHGN